MDTIVHHTHNLMVMIKAVITCHMTAIIRVIPPLGTIKVLVLVLHGTTTVQASAPLGTITGPVLVVLGTIEDQGLAVPGIIEDQVLMRPGIMVAGVTVDVTHSAQEAPTNG